MCSAADEPQTPSEDVEDGAQAEADIPRVPTPPPSPTEKPESGQFFK